MRHRVDSETRRETRQATLREPVGVVREAGEALGKPRPSSGAGAFASFRPLEAGDNLSAAVRDDLIVYAHAAETGLRAPVPRVVTRFDERARAVSIVINLGVSMRLPLGSTGSPKIVAAAMAIEVFAAIGFQHRAEVTIFAVGLNGVTQPLGPLSGTQEAGDIARYLATQAKRTPSQDQVDLGGLEFAGSLIYISDFLTEDFEIMRRFAAAHEGEGREFGAMLVYSPSEFLLLDSGLSVSTASACDRTDWHPRDLARAHSQFVAEVEHRFGQGRGGFTVLSSDTRADEFLASIRDGLLIDLMR